MSYALVKAGLVVFEASDSTALSRYLYDTEGLNVSLPEDPNGASVGEYVVMPVEYINEPPLDSVSVGGMSFEVSGVVVKKYESRRPLTIEEVRRQRLDMVEGYRNTSTNKDVYALGTRWQADERSQKLLGNAITLAIAGLPLPPMWRDADNNNVEITSINQLLAIAGAMAIQTQAAYEQSWTLKREIEVASFDDIPNLDAIIGAQS